MSLAFESQSDVLQRLGVSDGQFFAYFCAKNQMWWLLADSGPRRVGYGDLRVEDIARIQKGLRPGERLLAMFESPETGWTLSADLVARFGNIVIHPGKVDAIVRRGRVRATLEDGNGPALAVGNCQPDDVL